MQGLWNLIGKVGQGSGQAFPYEIGEKLPGLEGKSIWSLHRGKKKGSNEEVSIFAFDVKNSPPNQHEIAQAEFKRLKTLRHPNVLKFVDGLESDAFIYMVTEYVRPLEEYLQENRNDMEISWGIHQVVSALDFLVNNGNLIHGNVCISSIFVDHGGEWKLGGVAYVQSAVPVKGATIQVLSSMPWMQKYEPPEGRFEGKPKPRSEKWSSDMWGLGCLIWEVFNGALSKSSSLKSVGKIPGNLLSHYGELVSANPKSRPNPSKFMTQCKARGQYLCNSFVDANLFLAELQMKSMEEQKEFFKSLGPSLDSFPQQFCKDKILPQLLNAFEYGSAGSTVLGPLFKIGKLLETDEYQQKIVPCVVKLFSLTDRATRIQLLQQLDQFVQHLQPSVVNDQIFPNIALGFGDTVPAMREHTIKSMLLLTPKLDEKTINNQLLKYFAKLQMDEQPGIRTNTTVCLGKVARFLPEATRQKVLVSAFLRALRDPFPPARMAGINALCTTQEYTSMKDCATRVLPALCTMTIDPEKPVRTQAIKAVRVLVEKVEKFSEEMAENQTSSQKDSPQSSDAPNTSSTWTGWAVNSLTSKLYKGNVADNVSGKEKITSSDKKPENKSQPVRAENQERKIESSGGQRLSEEERNSDSDYEDNDGWGNDGNWDEEENLSGVKKELLMVRDELSSITKDDVIQSVEGDQSEEGSDSDFGDWEQDNWISKDTGFSTTKKEAKVIKETRQQEKKGALKLSGTKKPTPLNEDALLSELLGGDSSSQRQASAESSVPNTNWSDDWSDMKDSFVQDDNWTSEFLHKESKKETKNKNVAKKTQKTAKDDGTNRAKKSTFAKNDDEWGSESWAPMRDVPNTTPSVATTTSSVAKTTQSLPEQFGESADDWGTDGWSGFDDEPDEELSKADIAKRKREERRRQREQALKEKRAAKGTGGMKLGVKKPD